MYWFSIFLLRVYEVPGTIVSAEIYLWTKQTRFPSHSVNILERRGRHEWVSEWVRSVQTRPDSLLGQHSLFAGGIRGVLVSFRRVPNASYPVYPVLLEGTVWGQRAGRTALSFAVPLFPSAIKTQTQWFESSARYPRLKVLREDGLTSRPHALPCESCTLN